LPQFESPDIGEYQVKGAEEEVEDTKKDGRKDAEVQTHRLQREKEHRPVQRAKDGLQHRAVHIFNRGHPSLISRFLAQSLGLSSQQPEKKVSWCRE